MVGNLPDNWLMNVSWVVLWTYPIYDYMPLQTKINRAVGRISKFDRFSGRLTIEENQSFYFSGVYVVTLTIHSPCT